MTCKKCGKHILQPNTTYGINPNAVCNCTEPQKSEASTYIPHTIGSHGVKNSDWPCICDIFVNKSVDKELYNLLTKYLLGNTVALIIYSLFDDLTALISQREAEAYEKGIQDGHAAEYETQTRFKGE